VGGPEDQAVTHTATTTAASAPNLSMSLDSLEGLRMQFNIVYDASTPEKQSEDHQSPRDIFSSGRSES
jgi:hypothetical protein